MTYAIIPRFNRKLEAGNSALLRPDGVLDGANQTRRRSSPPARHSPGAGGAMSSAGRWAASVASQQCAAGRALTSRSPADAVPLATTMQPDCRQRPKNVCGQCDSCSSRRDGRGKAGSGRNTVYGHCTGPKCFVRVTEPLLVNPFQSWHCVVACHV